jgi:hypothetical protein
MASTTLIGTARCPMTGKQVEQANNLGRIANMAGQMDPVGDVQTQRFFADHLAFSRRRRSPRFRQARKSANKPRQVLDRTQPGQRTQPEFSLTLDHAGQRVGTVWRYRRRCGCHWDAMHLGLWLLPNVEGDSFQILRTDHSATPVPRQCDDTSYGWFSGRPLRPD